MTEKEKRELIYGKPPHHDEISCKALAEYDSLADHVNSPGRLMIDIAMKYGTTTEEMKRHWRCIRPKTATTTSQD